MKLLSIVFALLVLVAPLACANTNGVGKSTGMELLANGDRYSVHLTRGKHSPVPGAIGFLRKPSAALVHTSRVDGRIQQLFAEDVQIRDTIAAINYTTITTRSIEDVKADWERLYLLVRIEKSSGDQLGRKWKSVSLELRVFWLDDGQPLSVHQLLRRTLGEKTPDVAKEALQLSANGVSCLERIWEFEGKALREKTANKPDAGDS